MKKTLLLLAALSAASLGFAGGQACADKAKCEDKCEKACCKAAAKDGKDCKDCAAKSECKDCKDEAKPADKDAKK
jgi:hypothetical protein